MRDLPTTYPTLHQQCMEGHFTVQRSENAFAQIACDQTIEQSANLDSKTKGGFYHKQRRVLPQAKEV